MNVAGWLQSRDGPEGPSAPVSAAEKGFNTAVPSQFPLYVAGGGPGGWASNHFVESRLVTGWTFAAVRAVARVCAKAQPICFATGARAADILHRAHKAHRKGLVPTEVYDHFKATVQASNHDGGDSVPLPPDFPLNRLLRRPNPWMTRGQFLFQHAQQSCATGTTLMWVRRDGVRRFDRRGTPRQLYIIPTGITFPVPPDAREYPNGAYRVMPVGTFGGMRPDADPFGDVSWMNLMISGGVVDGREVMPIRWPHVCFLTDALSPMDAGQLWIDVGNQLDRATWAGFKNTLRPGYIFQMQNAAEEPTREESDRFDAIIRSRLGGPDNVGRHMRLPKGVEIADADRSVRELDYANGRTAIGHNILGLFGVTPIACGFQEPGAYAAYYAAMISFMDQAVAPILQLLADALEHDLAPAFGGDIEVHVPTPPIHDKEQAEREHDLDCRYGYVTFNEARKRRKLPPLPADIGDLLIGTDVAGVLAKKLGIDLGEGVPDTTANPSSTSGSSGPGGKPPPGSSPAGSRQPGGTPGPDQPQRTGPASRTGPAGRVGPAGSRTTSRAPRKQLAGPPSVRPTDLLLPGDAVPNLTLVRDLYRGIGRLGAGANGAH
jgi:hypothetical protein